MFDDFKPVTIKEVDKALAALEKIERPDGDNEGDPINSPSVYNYLSHEDQKTVDEAEKTLANYTRAPDGSPNKRAITAINKRGHDAYLGPDQYDPYKIVGKVTSGEWTLDLSDPSTEDEDH